ncbi:hypothetical protein DM02DRAFT_611601 [Periconia macrospinosa]|uniref:RING-type domain-containing protein n=1 Tax=Periconia macrospinosa TaxID=97972 RepID=A0A2V1E4Q7_9PLEO|nr:hypothetical protein DM02DRAFT_611601 [Periconia macrospinosa]
MTRAVWWKECDKAKRFLKDTIKLHEKTHDKPQMVRLFRSAIEKQMDDDKKSLTDMERLYMTLTDPDDDPFEIEWDAEDHIDTAFALILHHNYADVYEDMLEKLRDVAGREANRSLSPSQRIMRRIIEKARSTKIDTFACAAPLATIRKLPEEEQSCPICRNGYLDTKSFSIDALIADYPHRIIHCGHIIGKECLETWMRTPLPDPARYPQYTCPICRIPLKNDTSADLPSFLYEHISKNESVKKIKKKGDLRTKDIYGGILGCLSEEFALQELGDEIQRQWSDDKILPDQKDDWNKTLLENIHKIRQEKTRWGFLGSGMEIEWQRMGQVWMGSGTTL